MDLLGSFLPGTSPGANPTSNFYLEILTSSLISSSNNYFYGGIGGGGLSDQIRIHFADIPEDLTIYKQANYGEERIPGRSEPWIFYNDSECTIITFTGKLIATGDPKDRDLLMSLLGKGLGYTSRFVPSTAPYLGIAGNAVSMVNNYFKGKEDPIPTIYASVIKKIYWLEALTYPQYNDVGEVYPPPLVRLNFGPTLVRQGVIKNLQVNVRAPWEVSTLMPYYAEARITFMEVNAKPKGFYEAITGMPQPTTKQTSESFWEGAAKEITSIAVSSTGL
jgi:hypothetical protein